MRGTNTSYKKWVWHGEISDGIHRALASKSGKEYLSKASKDELGEMIHDAEEDNKDLERSGEFVRILDDSEKPLRDGSRFTKLSFLVRIFNLKARNGINDKDFQRY